MQLEEILKLLQEANEELLRYCWPKDGNELNYVAQHFLELSIGYLKTSVYGYEEDIVETVREAQERLKSKYNGDILE